MVEKESFSALFDGDKVDEATVEALLDDKDMQDTWQRFSIVRDVLRSDDGALMNWNIANSVAFALEDEVAHEKNSKNVNTSVTSLQSRQPSPERARQSMPIWLQQLSQVGIAASVAIVAIFGVQQYNSGFSESSTVTTAQQPPVLMTIPLQGSAQPVGLRTQEPQSMPTEAQLMEQRRRINAVLSDYELQLRMNSNLYDTASEMKSEGIK